MRKVEALALTTLFALSGGCGRGGAEPRPLTYDGATSISRHVLDEAIPAFERKAGVSFGRVDQSGGGKGLARLFSGEVEIAGVARRLDQAELRRHPHFQIIGYDALGVWVHASNPVKGLSKAQLKAIFTGAIVNWKDVGGANLRIVGCTEPLGSGRSTLAVFQSAALDDAPFGPVHEAADPTECVDLVTRTPGAITFATLAYALPGARAIPVDGVEPSAAHVLDSSYLLSRPLLLVTREQPTGAAAAFFDFMLSADGQRIVGRKFIPVRSPGRPRGAPSTEP